MWSKHVLGAFCLSRLHMGQYGPVDVILSSDPLYPLKSFQTVRRRVDSQYAGSSVRPPLVGLRDRGLIRDVTELSGRLQTCAHSSSGSMVPGRCGLFAGRGRAGGLRRS